MLQHLIPQSGAGRLAQSWFMRLQGCNDLERKCHDYVFYVAYRFGLPDEPRRTGH